MGLYHYKARAYSPTLGRFMQTDPIGYADGINLYGYVNNDPIGRTDPFGETDISAFGAEYGDDPGWVRFGSDFDIPGMFTVGGRGAPSGWLGSYDGSFRLTAVSIGLASAVSVAGGESIFILACNIGQSSVPQELARLTGGNVWASTSYLWIRGDANGDWRIFSADKHNGQPGRPGEFAEFNAHGRTGRHITGIRWNPQTGEVHFQIHERNSMRFPNRTRNQTVYIPPAPSTPPAKKPPKKPGRA